MKVLEWAGYGVDECAVWRLEGGLKFSSDEQRCANAGSSLDSLRYTANQGSLENFGQLFRECTSFGFGGGCMIDLFHQWPTRSFFMWTL